MRIGQLALRAGVDVETVRYNQRIGLLSTPGHSYGAFRSYSEPEVSRLCFIRRAKGLGFSLDEIRTLLELSREDCADVQRLAVRKLALVRDKLAGLQRMEAALAEMIERCRARRKHAPCPIIETLAHPDEASA